MFMFVCHTLESPKRIERYPNRAPSVLCSVLDTGYPSM